MRVCEVCACESVGLYLCTCMKARGQHCVSPCLIAHLILVRQDSPHPELGQQHLVPASLVPPVSSGLVLQGVQDLAWVLGPHAYATSPLGH